MRRMLLAALLAVSSCLVAGAITSCGPEPKVQYTERTAAIVNEWRGIIDRWNASPGDATVATDFVELTAKAQAIAAPQGMEDVHKLLLSAMDAESTSFELYAVGDKEKSASLHEQALSAMDTYMAELKDLGLLK